MAGIIEELATKWVSDDLAELTEGRDSFYHCEECRDAILAHAKEAIKEALERAAQEAEQWQQAQGYQIAAAIRALKG